MAKRSRAHPLKARFPRLRQLRQEQLGWEIVDILSRLPGSKPSISSIYRLEQGEAIRMSGARRVFDVINGALQNYARCQQRTGNELVGAPGVRCRITAR
jgi:hypothetical protein